MATARERTDFLIIGSGIAGLRAAVDLSSHGVVTVLTKSDPRESNTGYAQGGIAAAVGRTDAPEAHFEDTVAAGDGLCDEDAVRVLVEEGVGYVRELIDWGAAFDRDEHGEIALGREGAHRVRRVLHARDATGREIGRVLWSRVADQPNVRVLPHTRALSLLVSDGVCRGASYSDGGTVARCEARAVLLATGGAGQVYRETTNPEVATGDGLATAWRAGARVADLEFVQFHPTALDAPGAPRFLLSEALRGEGAYLLNESGERFLRHAEPRGELASRDVVARAIVREQQRSGGAVYLSLQHLDAAWVHDRFPTVAAACRSAGFDLARDRIPVGPAAHYVMGGVETDTWGRTTLPALFAAGEVACTGVHGANRLASNSLLEGLVFGARAATAMRQPWTSGGMAQVRIAGTKAERHEGTKAERHEGTNTEARVRELMWDAVGLLRSEPALRAAVDELQSHHASSDLALVGWLIARAARRREESRGAHFRADFPARDDLHWRFHMADQDF